MDSILNLLIERYGLLNANFLYDLLEKKDYDNYIEFISNI